MSIDYLAEMKPKCSDYLHVICEGKEITIEEYISVYSNDQKVLSITHDQLKDVVFVYRNSQCSYNELCDSKITKTELYQFYNNDLYNEFNKGFSPENWVIKRCLLKTVDRYLNKARFEAIKAATILDIDFMNANFSMKNYTLQYMLRCHYAENAIYSYYAVFEILMLVIWTSKGYHKIQNYHNFMDICKSCDVKKLLAKLKDDDPQMLELFANVDRNKNPSIKCVFGRVRDWCNKFKHRGILRFEGEELDNEPQIYIQITDEENSQEECLFSSKDYSYEYIDLDKEVIPALKAFHDEFIKVAKQVVEKCKTVN